MAFEFHQLDKISDFDEALEILEDEYIPELLDIFAESPEAKAYLEAHPDEPYLGDWIGNFLHFAYTYLGVPLPKIKEKDASTVLLNLFPSKMSLADPNDADTIIPELIALWEFLQREYKHCSSRKVLNLLRKIQPTYKDTMNDPRNFGIAKSFFTAGRSAGFDMTTQEGLEAFQQQYNQQLRETGTPPLGFPNLLRPQTSSQPPQPSPSKSSLPIPKGVPPEFVALLGQQMGLGPIPGLENLPTDRDQLIEALTRHLLESGEVRLDDAADNDDNFGVRRNVQSTMIGNTAEEHGIQLSEKAIALLQKQTITDTEPGTIVHDFQVLLEAMGDRGIPVSGKLNQFSLKVLEDLNSQLSQPIQIALKRPQQKSYPNLHGLYLLLRVTGIAEVAMEGKQAYIRRNSEMYDVWQSLNPTEKYFTLLEAWVIRGDAELLGDSRSPMNEGTRVLNVWPQLMTSPKTYKTYNEQTNLNYWPGLHNLALMQMFGWVELTCLKPDTGKGWRVKKVASLPVGDAIVTTVLQAYVDQNFEWRSERDFTQPWGELQPYFQSYFPEWKANLAAIAPPEHQTGTYIFKVSLRQIWRRISISSEATLNQLGSLIRESVDFDSDHLDMFSFKDRMGRTQEIQHPYNEWEAGPFSDEVTVGDLPLTPGMYMTYLFDFGDHWEFSLLLEEIQPGKPKRGSNKILERHGKAPEQYPDWD